MQKNKIQIELEVLDNGTVRVKQFAGESSKALGSVADASDRATGRMRAGWEKLKSAWMGVIAGIYAVKKAWDMMQTAAKAIQERKAFDNMAASYETSGDKIIATLKRVSGHTIDTMTLVRTAGTSMMMGIAPDKITKLMEIARATARQTGQTVQKAFEDISLGVARQSKMILDNLGIMVSVEKANEKYATAIGKTASQLTDAEKKQAFMNATLKAGDNLMNRLGKQSDTASDRIERYAARWKDASIFIGKAILSVVMGFETMFTAAGSTVNWVVAKVTGGAGKIVNFASKIPLVGKHLKGLSNSLKGVEDNAKRAADIGIKHMSETWDTLISLWKNSEPTRKGVIRDLKNQAASAAKVADANKKIADQAKQIVDAEKEAANLRKAAIEAMYNDAEIDAEAYYTSEASDLIEKVSKWEKAGVDINKINEYLYDQFGKMAEEAWGKGEDAAAEYVDTMQAKSQVLVSEFQQMEQENLTVLGNIGVAITDLDGSNIGVTFSLYDNASAALDRITEKINALKRSMDIPILEPAMNAESVSQQSNAGLESQAGQESVVTNNQSIVNEGSVNLNINQKLSRSDVVNIVAEQERQKLRG